jgi:WD40 repeat protein
MRKLEVLVEEHALGSVRPVEVGADVTVGALVPALVEKLQLPQTDLSGKKLVYTLRSASAGYVLPDNTTLLASGVGPGTRLALDAYVLDDAHGGMVSPLPVRQSKPFSPVVADPAYHSSVTIADADQFVAIERQHPPGYIPTRKKKRSLTRRTFLLTGGVALAVSGTGLGYAAYRSFLNGLLKTATMRQAHPTTSPTHVVTVKQTLPTMAKPAMTFTRHQAIVRSIAWSPDGTMLASGADDALLLLWGMDGVVHHTVQHPASVHVLAWSPDGQRLVTGSANQVLFLQALTGTPLARSTRRHAAAVTGLAWSLQSPTLVVSGALDRRAIVWNTTTYQAQALFARHTTPIEAVSWAADGQTVASSSQGGAVRVWSAMTAREIHGAYEDAAIRMRTLAFAPTGMQLAVGGEDGQVRIWNGVTCQLQVPGRGGTSCKDVPQRLKASTKAVRSLAWSPDARFLATGGDDGTVAIWYPTHSQQPLFTFQQSASVHSLAWSPKGDQLVTASGNVVTVWNVM